MKLKLKKSYLEKIIDEETVKLTEAMKVKMGKHNLDEQDPPVAADLDLPLEPLPPATKKPKANTAPVITTARGSLTANQLPRATGGKQPVAAALKSNPTKPPAAYSAYTKTDAPTPVPAAPAAPVAPVAAAAPATAAQGTNALDVKKMAAGFDQMILNDPQTAFYAAKGFERDKEAMTPELFAAATKAGYSPSPAYAGILKAAGVGTTDGPAITSTTFAAPASAPEPKPKEVAQLNPAQQKQATDITKQIQDRLIKLDPATFQPILTSAGAYKADLNGVDGVYGKRTKQAVNKYFADKKMPKPAGKDFVDFVAKVRDAITLEGGGGEAGKSATTSATPTTSGTAPASVTPPKPAGVAASGFLTSYTTGQIVTSREDPTAKYVVQKMLPDGKVLLTGPGGDGFTALVDDIKLQENKFKKRLFVEKIESVTSAEFKKLLNAPEAAPAPAPTSGVTARPPSGGVTTPSGKVFPANSLVVGADRKGREILMTKDQQFVGFIPDDTALAASFKEGSIIPFAVQIGADGKIFDSSGNMIGNKTPPAAEEKEKAQAGEEEASEQSTGQDTQGTLPAPDLSRPPSKNPEERKAQQEFREFINKKFSSVDEFDTAYTSESDIKEGSNALIEVYEKYGANGVWEIAKMYENQNGETLRNDIENIDMSGVLGTVSPEVQNLLQQTISLLDEAGFTDEGKKWKSVPRPDDYIGRTGNAAKGALKGAIKGTVGAVKNALNPFNESKQIKVSEAVLEQIILEETQNYLKEQEEDKELLREYIKTLSEEKIEQIFEEAIKEAIPFGAIGKMLGKGALKGAKFAGKGIAKGAKSAGKGVMKYGKEAAAQTGQDIKSQALNYGMGALSALSGGEDEEGDTWSAKLGNIGATAGGLAGDVAGGVAGTAVAPGVGTVAGGVAGGTAGAWLGRGAGKLLGSLVDKFTSGDKQAAAKDLAKVLLTGGSASYIIMNAVKDYMTKEKDAEAEDVQDLLNTTQEYTPDSVDDDLEDASDDAEELEDLF
jgi:hypothetical protein